MKRLYLILLVLLFQTSFGILTGQNKINQYEYWFDSNFNGRVTTGITPVSNFDLNTGISATGLNEGLHSFHIRFRDDSLRYSSVLSSFFIKTGNTTTLNPVMDSYEYWFDNDFAGRTTGSLANQPNVNLNTAIPASMLSNGLHTFHIRFKDSQGQWSSVLSQFFYKQGGTTSVTPQMIEYEYWFDNDYANSISSPMGGNANEQVVTGIDASMLGSGLHTFHIRFKDGTGKWSSVLSQFFYRPATQGTSITNKVIAYRYWYDNDFVNNHFIQLPVAVNPLGLLTNIDMTRIWKGTHQIHFQFKDTVGMWSSVLTDTVIKVPFPIAEYQALNTTICVGDTVYFTNTSMDGDIYYWDFGDTQFSTDSIPYHIYNQAGDFDVRLTVTDTATGLDSTFIYTNYIHVGSIANSSISIFGNDTICFGNTTQLIAEAGYNYLWSTNETNDTISVSTPGDYHVLISNILYPSCQVQSDTVSIVVNPVPLVNLGSDSILCGGQIILDAGNPGANYEWNDLSNGQTLIASSSNQYYVEVTNNFNCSGSDTINITIHPVPFVDLGEDTTRCGGQILLDAGNSGSSYQWNDLSTSQTLNVTVSGSYYVEVTNAFNCSASDTIDVTIHSLPVVNLGADIIQSNPPATLDAGSGFANYLWSTTETSQSIQVNTNGNYWVLVTDLNGCQDSDTITVTFTTGFIENENLSLQLYPNPSSGPVFIKWAGEWNDHVIISIFSTEGKVIQNMETSLDENGFIYTLNLEGLSNGMYFIVIQNEKGTISRPVILKK